MELIAVKPNHLRKLFATYKVYEKLPCHFIETFNELCFSGVTLEDYISYKNITYIKERGGMHNYRECNGLHAFCQYSIYFIPLGILSFCDVGAIRGSARAVPRWDRCRPLVWGEVGNPGQRASRDLPGCVEGTSRE